MEANLSELISAPVPIALSFMFLYFGGKLVKDILLAKDDQNIKNQDNVNHMLNDILLSQKGIQTDMGHLKSGIVSINEAISKHDEKLQEIEKDLVSIKSKDKGKGND